MLDSGVVGVVIGDCCVWRGGRPKRSHAYGFEDGITWRSIKDARTLLMSPPVWEWPSLQARGRVTRHPRKTPTRHCAASIEPPFAPRWDRDRCRALDGAVEAGGVRGREPTHAATDRRRGSTWQTRAVITLFSSRRRSISSIHRRSSSNIRSSLIGDGSGPGQLREPSQESLLIGVPSGSRQRPGNERTVEVARERKHPVHGP
jgi:hypothetical protein